jgi:hypothetical protein
VKVEKPEVRRFQKHLLAAHRATFCSDRKMSGNGRRVATNVAADLAPNLKILREGKIAFRELRCEEGETCFRLRNSYLRPQIRI